MSDEISSVIKIEEASKSREIPSVLPIMPLENIVLFPSMIAPIVVGDEKSRKMVDEALADQRMVGVFTRRGDANGDLNRFENLYETGTAAVILKMLKMPDGSLRILLHGTQRIKIIEGVTTKPYLQARVEPFFETPVQETREVDALVKSLHGLLGKAIELSSLPEDLRVAAINITDVARLADLVASNLNLKVEEQQDLLEEGDVYHRLKRIHYILNREIEVLELGSRIQSRVKTELDKNQREYLLREQMKAIRHELGEDEGPGQDLDDLEDLLEQKTMPDYARETARKELNRLRSMQPSSAEYSVSRTYIDVILDLPWMESTKDSLDIAKARKILNRDHYNLEKTKERILEHLAVLKLKNDMKGPILCLVGPPGVGKTSLGRSVAAAMGRKFVRFSLGGMRDEAEIRGHRRTYIGAMPGRILKNLRQVEANNPVMMLDEIDKIGSDYRGDPSSALLEVLDPEQNNTFSDHYLDMPFDLSKVLFLTTANRLDTIPGPLRDRMEVIEVSGYALHEKVEIAKKFTIPKQIEENGITTKNISFTNTAIVRLIEGYTQEAGVRGLERQIGAVCRKVARLVAEKKVTKVHVNPDKIKELLGPPTYYQDTAQRTGVPGVSIGLAWTPVGGDILFIEATITMGSGKFVLTGQLGDVMKESAQAAMTYIHTVSEELKIPEELFSRRDIHLHVPAGAIPKDGPSAGIAMATAITSLLTGRKVRDFLAMTGEITLIGNVLPVGGIKEKVLAAHRAGIRHVILPERNKVDADKLPAEVKKKLTIHYVKHMDEVLEVALLKKKDKNASRLLQPMPAPGPSAGNTQPVPTATVVQTNP